MKFSIAATAAIVAFASAAPTEYGPPKGKIQESTHMQHIDLWHHAYTLYRWLGKH